MPNNQDNEYQEALRYPCSPTQHRFWVLDQLEPGDPSLNVAVRWQINGDLAADTLKQALHLMMMRHEVLRTHFALQSDQPEQVVQAHCDIDIPLVDLRSYTVEEAERKSAEIAAKEARTPFQLAVAPLIRASHILLPNERAIVLVTAHHIICDGWSVGLIAAEMGEICDALQHSREPNLEELSISYGDYSAWINEWLAGEELEEDQQYWEKQLQNAHYFELFSDKPRPLTWHNDSTIISTLLERNLSNKLEQLASSQGCTLYMVALATLFTLLHRYSGEHDIAIGTQVAGRGEVETEALIGLFINTLVLRSDLSGNPSYIELLGRIRSMVSDAFEHEYMPIEKLIELLKPKRDASRNPLFSINFIYQRSFVNNSQYEHFNLVDLPSQSAGALYDLNFFMVERPEGWRFSCEYNTSLFEQSTVERLVKHFEHLLHEITGNAQQAIAELSLLDSNELADYAQANHQTAIDYPSELTFGQLFTEQAKATPLSTAVICGEQRISYKALDDASTLLAENLIVRGWAPYERVGIFMHRSIDMVIALLAVLKSGSAYVPLDPRYPQDRLNHITADARMKGMLSTQDLAKTLSDIDVALWLVDQEVPTAISQPQKHEIKPEDTAYVIYTSGSTGLPKGVPIHHKALVNFLCSMRTAPGIEQTDTLLAVTTIAFDIAALEIYLPLLVGARVVLANEKQVVDGSRLNELIDQHQVSIMQATPVTWHMLLGNQWPKKRELKMLCGGESLPHGLALQLLDKGSELWNLYGPTETTIWSSLLRVHPEDTSVMLGGPIANTQFYLLDAYGQHVPIGSPGELYIGGDGVAQGYFERTELTHERFLPDPFSHQPGALMYRTGDLMRWRVDGNLDFLGRTDFQVKLRGYRIELGEIESVLLSDEQIKECVVVLGENQKQEAVLWAYLVAQDTDSNIENIEHAARHKLRSALPAYMHPSSITVLEHLPRTPNGKIDRKALPVPTVGTNSNETEEPLDEAQRYLASIWHTVLEYPDAITKSDNFFELGGHSINAARMLARIEQGIGRTISLAQLFQHPTLEELAELTRPKGLYEDDFRQVVRIQANGSKPPLIALHNTGTYFSVSKALGDDYPFISLQLFDPDYPPESLPTTLEDVASGYIKLILQAQPHGPYYILGWCVIGVLAFEVARQMRNAGHRVTVVVIDGWTPNYVRKMPFIKARITRSYYRALVVYGETKRALQGDFKFSEWVQKRLTIRRNKSRQRDLMKQHKEHINITDKQPKDLERYGQWLFAYLEDLVAKHEIQHYFGGIYLIRSEQEPTSYWLPWDLDWCSYTDNVEIAVATGDHWSMLRDQGAIDVANELKAILSAEPNDSL